MSVVTIAILSVLVGWLATLVLQSDVDDVTLLDFAIAVIGAGIAGALVAPDLGIAVTGTYGFTLPGTLASWAGAMSLLCVANLLRRGRLRCGRRTRGGSLPAKRTECAPHVQSVE